MTHIYRVLVTFGLGVFVTAFSIRADEAIGQAHVRWKVGDSWAVCDWSPRLAPPTSENPTQTKMDYMAGKRFFRFEVIDEVEIEGLPCFDLFYVAYDPKTNADCPEYQCFKLYYGKETGVLEFMADRSVQNAGTRKSEKPRRIATEGSGYLGEYVKAHVYNEFAMGYLTDVPLMFPVWDQKKREWPKTTASRLRVVSQDAPRKVQLGNRWLTQELAERSDKNGEFTEYRLKGNFQDKEDEGTNKILVQGEYVMEFRPGEPWWRVCRRYEYGQYVRHWALIRIGTTDLPVEEPVLPKTAK